MKQHLLQSVGTAALFACLAASNPSAARSDDNIRAATFVDVQFADSLWAGRQETNRRTTIPYVLGQLKQRGSLSGFAVLAGKPDEKYRGYMWADSDVYKTLEGIAQSLRANPDASLEKEAEGIIGLIVRAQAADGYLMPHLQIAEPACTHYAEETTRTCESYSQGHLIESAVAHFEATGRREYLDAAIKTADLLARVHAEGQLEKISGHPEIEIALVKLARAAGNDKYLTLAKSYVANARTWGSIWSAGRPFLAHDEPAGHAVAACYLYAGGTDVAALTGDAALLDLLKTKWEKLAGRKMYLTGGTGHSSYLEGFAPDYDLPNEKAYCETCASLAVILWSHRLFLATGDARYLDVVERALYNGLLAGVGLSGDKFFYVNPLASRGNHHRQPWLDCTCCPTNIVRFFPTLGQYVYASTDNTVYVNLYAAGSGKVKLGSHAVTVSQETQYPWDGAVRLTVNPIEPQEFTVALRIPGWCREESTPGGLYRSSGPSLTPTLKVNGTAFDAGALEAGFARMRRLLTFFDDCHRHEGIELDKPTEPVKGYHNGRWAACPQDRDRKPENLPQLQAYVQDVVRAHARDPRVLWWEVFNEPNMKSEFSVNLRRLGYEWAQQVEPTQPVICCWDDSPQTDLVDAHNYDADFATWDQQADLNPDTGAVFTEAGARWYASRPSNGEPCEVIHWLGQRRATGRYVPGVYLCWELMAGNSNCRWSWGTPEGTPEPTMPWCGLMWPDATPVSLAEAEAIRRWTTGQSRAWLFDDFQDSPPPTRAGWTLYGGGDSGSRVMRLEPGQKMLAGDRAWTDYVLEAVVMLQGQEGNAGVVLRVNDPGPDPDQMRGYYVGFDTKLLYVGKIDNGWQPLGTFDLTKLDCRVVPGTWNQIRVAAAGSKIRVWFNRMHPSADQAAGLRLEVTDLAAPVLSGAVGLRTFQTAALFDNVIVLPLDALPSTQPLR
ncbi:MAG: beta-L-arabinofuranosidase domain-containing protein [Pirellulaceae bacterium]